MTSLPVDSNHTLPADPQFQALVDQIAAAETCWFSSVRPDGRTHLAPIWHVWHDGQIFVVSQAKSVRVRNIMHNPSVSVALPDPVNPIIVEGVAYLVPAAEAVLRPLFVAKYDWDITTDAEYGAIIAVTPHKLMAWGTHGDQRWHLRQAD